MDIISKMFYESIATLILYYWNPQECKVCEEKYDIFPFTKRPHFYLAEPVEKWVHGLSFDEILKCTTEDEGSFVRHLRMIIQLLREIQHAPHSPAKLQATAARARKLIDRDVVDAEKQLRV